ncbi:hypothetical protein ILYODFUR_034913, partial [Ilyodon furcidens]
LQRQGQNTLLSMCKQAVAHATSSQSTTGPLLSDNTERNYIVVLDAQEAVKIGFFLHSSG